MGVPRQTGPDPTDATALMAGTIELTPETGKTAEVTANGFGHTAFEVIRTE